MSDGRDGGRELWQRAQKVFEAVVDLEPAARRQRLEVLTADDPGLADAVADLLEADASTTDTRLDQPIWPTTLGLLAEAPRHGQRLGAWELGELLGAGGMGEVWAAERVDGEFRQRAAIKLLPPLAGNAAVDRFRRERQILADLAHPSIATLLDGGVADGRPFLVMERIDGLDLLTFCGLRRSSLDERLHLLGQVADAVAHAHRRGVVHRDIKPQNILVNEEGLPKLLDFGIAELMAETGGGDAPGGLMVSQRLSPGYCAPEQLSGTPVGAAADVFSLGVVLFELLSGRRPWAGPWGSLRQLREAIEAGTPRLAEGLSEGETLDALAEERRTTPGRLRRQLSGDLQAVVDRALDPDPDRRYDGAGALAADLERWCARHPVVAHEATVGYRLRKLVARRPVATLVVTSALLLALGAGWSRQRHREAAEGWEQQAGGSVEALVDVFRLVDPVERSGRPLSSRGILSRGEEKARDELGEAPLAMAQVLVTLADGYRGLGDLQKAGELAEEALALRRRESADGGLEPNRLAESLDQVGELHRLQGRFESAKALGDEALELWRSLDDVSPGVIARTLDHLAETLHEQGRYKDAELLYKESLAMRCAELGEDHPLVAESQAHLGLLLKNQGQDEDALGLYRQALELRKRVLPEGHPDIAESLYLVGSMEGVLGQVEEARSDLEQAAELHRRIYGEEHPKTLLVLHDLGLLLSDLELYDEAEPLLRRVLELRQSLYSEPHPEVAQSYTALSTLLYQRGDFEGALESLNHSVEINRSLFTSDHPWVLNDLMSLALFENRLGRPEAAEDLLRKALAGFRGSVESPHRGLCRALANLGDTASRLGRGDAGELLNEGLECFRDAAGAEHPSTLRVGEKLEAHRRRVAEAPDQSAEGMEIGSAADGR